jgi:hypothetical protein
MSYVQNIPNKKKIEISECLSNSLGQSAVGSNTKINIKETDQLDVFNGRPSYHGTALQCF